MKKGFVALLTLVLVALLSGCRVVQFTELVIAVRNMNKLDSYYMNINMEIINIGEFSTSAAVDGNYMESYPEYNVVLKSMYDQEKWYPLEMKQGLFYLDKDVDLNPEINEEYTDFDLFRDFNYEEDGDYFVFKGDMIEDIDTIKLLIEDNQFSEMIMIGEMDFDGDMYDVEITVEYSQFDIIQLDKPQLVFTEEELDQHIENGESFGIDSAESMLAGFMEFKSSMVNFYHNGPTISCYYLRGHCSIFLNDELYHYFPEDHNVINQETHNELSLETFISMYSNNGFTEDMFDYIDTTIGYYVKTYITE